MYQFIQIIKFHSYVEKENKLNFSSQQSLFPT